MSNKETLENHNSRISENNEDLTAILNAINNLGPSSGNGDMLKSNYDTNNDGIVDNAEKVNGHTVYSDVPANAKFTDTVYDDTGIKQEITEALTAAKTYTDEELAKFDFIKVVDTLPQTGLPNKIYFVPKTDTQTQDLFDEYVWINGKWEWITTKQIEVDLTPYATKTYVDNAVANAGGEISNSATTNVPIYSIWVGSQEQYEAITTLDANTIYNIIEE